MITCRRFSIISFLFAALLMAACASSESNQQEAVKSTTDTGTTTASSAADAKARDYAFLRVVDAVVGGSSMDVSTDKESPFMGLAYKQETPYKEIHSEQQNIRVLPSGQPGAQPIATNRELVVAGHHYTGLLVNDTDGKNIVLRVFDDNITPPPAGKARIRVIHASMDTGEVDVFVGGNPKPLISDVGFQSATSYYDVAPMTTTLEIRPDGQQKTLLTVPNARFDAGKIYTLVVMGKSRGTPKLEATIIQDELVGMGSPSPTMSPMMSPTP